MAKVSDQVAVIKSEASRALGFLTDRGFLGPELTVGGVGYHRLGLHVYMEYWSWKNEHGVTTTLALISADGKQRCAQLALLNAACGLGLVRDVPEGAGTLHVIRTRIGQHATALRRLVPHLDKDDAENLFRQCGRGS